MTTAPPALPGRTWNKRLKESRELACLLLGMADMRVEETARQLAEWQSWRARLSRLRETAGVVGALSAEEFARRLDALAADTSKYAPEFQDEPVGSPGERLIAVRAA